MEWKPVNISTHNTIIMKHENHMNEKKIENKKTRKETVNLL